MNIKELIEREKEEFQKRASWSEELSDESFYRDCYECNNGLDKEKVKDFLTEAMQKAYESALREVKEKTEDVFGVCDTYEKGCAGCEVAKIINQLTHTKTDKQTEV